MKARHHSEVLAWDVIGFLVLLSCCYCCSCVNRHAVFSTSAQSSIGDVVVPPSRPCFVLGRSRIGRARASRGTFRGDAKAVSPCTATSAAVAGAGLELSRHIEEVILPPDRGLRVHSMSDLHTDSKANAEWVKTWASWKGYDAGDLGEAHEDILIVAGDVSSSLERSAETLTDLKERYDEVFFVVGNHEMWTGTRKPRTKKDRTGTGGDAKTIDSVEKLVQMHRMCESLGVRTDPVIFVVGGTEEGGEAGETGVTVSTEEGVEGTGRRLGEGVVGTIRRGRQELVVFPLLSWYHASWDDEPNLPPELQFRRGDFLRRWRDFSLCHWPDDLCNREDFATVDRDAPPVIAEFFARQNNACIKAFRSRGKSGDGVDGGQSGEEGEQEPVKGAAGGIDPLSSMSSGIGDGVAGAAVPTEVISFSHFVPRQELCPEKRLLWEPQLTKVIGSDPLERQIRELGSDLHIFGHTHIPIDMTSDGVRYVQWPLGSVREQSYRTNDMRKKGPLLVYAHDGREGGIKPPVHTLWGEFYEMWPRDPHDTDIPENTYEYMKQRIQDGRRRAKESS